MRVRVGKVGMCTEQTFFFKRILTPPSDIVVVTLPKPMGIVFEEKKSTEKKKYRIVVNSLVSKSNAEKAARVSKLFNGNRRNFLKEDENFAIFDDAVFPGDVLRATTTINVLVDFFGIRAPKRTVVLFFSDNRRWEEVMRALGASFFSDGPTTLIFERPRNSNFPNDRYGLK